MSRFWVKYKNLIEKKPYLENILIVGGVCLFAFTTATICKTTMGANEKNTEIVIDETKRDYYTAKYDEAIEALEKEEENEKWPIKTMEKSKIYSIKGDLVLSNSFAEKAYIQSRIQLDTVGFEKYKDEVIKLSNEITFTYLVNGQVEKAIEYGEIFLDEYSENEDLKKTLITAYVINGQKDSAQEILNSINIDEKDSYKVSELAELYLIAGDYENTLKNLKLAFKLDETNINILNVLKEYNEERKFIEYIRENEKDDIDNVFLAQIELMKWDSYDDAIKRINKIAEGTFSRLILELQASENDLDEKRSEILINELREKFEEHYGTTYVLSTIYTKNNDLENGAHYANKTLELNKNFGKAYLLFSDILKRKSENIDGVGSYIREGLLKNPYSIDLIKKAGEFYGNKGMNEVSYNYYNFATKLDIYDYKNYIAKANIESKGEDKKLPIETLNTALEIDSENSELYNYLGIIYIEEGNEEEGIKNIRKAYESDNKNIKALNNAAVYYTRYEKNISRAMSNINTANEIIKDKTEAKVKDTILVNFSLIKNVHDEVVETSNENWQLDNLEFLK